MENKSTKQMLLAVTLFASGLVLAIAQGLTNQPAMAWHPAQEVSPAQPMQPSAMYETFNPKDFWSYNGQDSRAEAVAVNGRDVYVAGFYYRSAMYRYDAYLMKYDSELRQMWNVTWGNFADDKAYGVAVSNNYIFVTGYTQNVSSGHLALFVAKFDPSGTLIWRRTFYTNPGVDIEGLAIAATSDAIYITGQDGTLVILLKCYQNGVLNWSETLSFGTGCRANGIAVDGSSVYVIGDFDFSGKTQLFVYKDNFNDTSSSSYLKTLLPGATDERGYGIAVSAGYIYITGRSGISGSASSYNAIIGKLDMSFSAKWMKYWDNPGGTGWNDSGLGIALAYNYVFVTGYSNSYGSVNYGILAAYRQDGTSLSNQTFGLVGDNTFGRGIATGRNMMFVAGAEAWQYTPNEYAVEVIRYSTVGHPSDLSYVQGTTGHSLEWVLYGIDMTVGEYYIFKNGVQVQTGTWNYVPINGYPITINVDGLAMGAYNYTLLAGLIMGDTVQDTALVTVTNAPPIITMPATVAINGSTLGNVLSCVINDSSTGITNYVVYRNETAVQSGIWANGIPVVWNIDGLAAGKYNFTIVVNDGLGGSSTGTTTATVSISTKSPTNPTPITPSTTTDPALDATLALAVVTLILVAVHFAWHLYKKVKSERGNKERQNTP